MDVDNITFTVALPERLRSQVEEKGHIELSDVQAAALARAKPVHVVLIVGAVLLATTVAGTVSGSSGLDAAFYLPFLSFLLAGIVEASCLPAYEDSGDEEDGEGKSGAVIVKAIAQAVGAAALGFVGFIVLFMLSLG